MSAEDQDKVMSSHDPSSIWHGNLSSYPITSEDVYWLEKLG